MLKVGSDPEVFVINKSTKEIVSAIPLIAGTKANPMRLDMGWIQHDNILAEFNSIPADNESDFIYNHARIIQDLKYHLNQFNCDILINASYDCPEELLADPISRIAGCEPDFNAWKTRQVKSGVRLAVNTPANYDVTNVRAAGGHLHISFDGLDEDYNLERRIKMVKALDLLLGVPSVKVDTDTLRRKYYGQAGSFRFKVKALGDAYDGVEYRTLSNFWLKSHSMMGWVFSVVRKVEANLDGYADIANKYSKEIQSVINTGNLNTKAAKTIFEVIGAL